MADLGVNGYVFSLGLVPVHEWFAEARRSRDLKAGSAFLAFVMWRLLARLEKEEATILLPFPPPEGFQTKAPESFAKVLDQYGIRVPPEPGILQATALSFRRGAGRVAA